MVNNLVNTNKATSKSELAQMYGIHTETLRRWIVGNQQLMDKLNHIGYNKHRNLLNPKELSIIREYIGY